jgi:3-hydroxyacyl-CoA dehydrogenase
MVGAIKHIAIIGGGKMGQNLFYFFAGKNYRLHWIVRSNLEQHRKKFQRKIKRELKNGLIDEAGFQRKQEHFQIHTDLTLARNADLFIECIREELPAKQNLLEEIARIKKPGALIATNSSSFLPQMLSADESLRQKIYGLHFFFPVETKATVELVQAQGAKAEDRVLLVKFLEENNRKVLLQKEQDALLLNRLMLYFQAAVFSYARQSGISLRQIDAALKEKLMPMGIFEMMDFVGLDLILQSAQTYLAREDKQHYSPLLEEMNRLSGSGMNFYQSEKEENPDFEKKREILDAVGKALGEAFLWAKAKTAIPEQDLWQAVEEYLDTEMEEWEFFKNKKLIQ